MLGRVSQAVTSKAHTHTHGYCLYYFSFTVPAKLLASDVLLYY